MVIKFKGTKVQVTYPNGLMVGTGGISTTPYHRCQLPHVADAVIGVLLSQAY